MSIFTWDELLSKPVKEPTFFIDPYIVKEGITMLWAPTSVGKSPLTWGMAAAIGSGTHFFGLPAKEGRVLYIEVDSPEQVVQSRLQKRAEGAPNVWFLFLKPLTIPMVRAEDLEILRDASDAVKPDVVFINTLRKVHRLDDKDSSTPVTVYGWFQHLFPKAALVFVHHTRKSATDPKALEHDRENFSGSMHFLDDAQIGLELKKWKGQNGENLHLVHHKSQATETLRAMPLLLGEDGTTLNCPLYNELLATYNLRHESDLKGGEFDNAAAQMGIVGSPATARLRRLVVENGEFPGSRKFLKKAREE